MGAATRLAIVTQPGSPIQSGEFIDAVPSIQLQDDQQNSVPLGGVAIRMEITSGQVGAALTGVNPRQTNTNGRANFTQMRISGPPDDDYVLTFTATVNGVDLPPVSADPITVTTGAATRIVIVQQPSANLQSGDEFAQQPVIEVQDASGNPIAGARTIAVELGQGDGNGTLTGDVTVSTGGGSTATFTDLGIQGEAGNYTLIFRSGTLTPDESDVVAVTNSAPTADNDAYSVDEDGTLNVAAGSGVLVGDTDPDGDGLTAVNGTQPANGTVSLQTNGSFTYTPDGDFNGSDSFTYQASDGRGNLSAAATVTITVNAVNDAPTFTAGPNVTTSSELSSLVGETHAAWLNVGAASPGPADESGQQVTFEVSVAGNEALFAELAGRGSGHRRPDLSPTDHAAANRRAGHDRGAGQRAGHAGQRAPELHDHDQSVASHK